MKSDPDFFLYPWRLKSLRAVGYDIDAIQNPETRAQIRREMRHRGVSLGSAEMESVDQALPPIGEGRG